MLDSLTVIIDNLAGSSLNNPVLALPVYLAAGFLSSLFPCVYPLIPVTVGFLQKRGGPGVPAWLHPLFYWGGTVIAYGILGLIAAIGGGAFNTFMQNGVVVSGTGFLFLFLTFAIMDWHPITFTGGQGIFEKGRSKSGLAYTTVMGLGAGFIASACVAPALVSMLLFIARMSAANPDPVYWSVYGTVLSSAFGAGLGIPFFLAGIFGAKLPRSGNWMNRVKVFFAVLIFIAALYQIIKGFQVLGYDDMNIMVILLGLALLALAALLGLRPPERGDRPALTRFIFGLFALALGLGSVVAGINYKQGDKQVSSIAVGDSTKYNVSLEELLTIKEKSVKEEIAGIHFLRDPDLAFALAKAENKPVFIDFYADWCTNCKDFYRLLESNKDLNEAIQKAVPLKVVDTDPFFDTFLENKDYEELNIGLPFFAILNSDSSLRWKTTSYRDSEGMIKALENNRL